MNRCAVCSNPRSPGLSPGQIRWHNHGHPKAVRVVPLLRQWAARRRADPFVVVIRPGDRVIYEAGAEEWLELSDASIAAADGEGQTAAVICSRCRRRVLDRKPRGAISRGLRRLFALGRTVSGLAARG